MLTGILGFWPYIETLGVYYLFYLHYPKKTKVSTFNFITVRSAKLLNLYFLI
jgi:hypothetical protein